MNWISAPSKAENQEQLNILELIRTAIDHALSIKKSMTSIIDMHNLIPREKYILLWLHVEY